MHSLVHRMVKVYAPVLACLLVGACAAAELTGNWVVAETNADGTARKTYFDLQGQGGHITGHIRTTQFYYSIKTSTGGPGGFSVTGSMMDGDRERTVRFEGKLVGEELHLVRQEDKASASKIARRAPSGEGAYPARIEPPQLHRVMDNGLAKTPPMGWNSWNKFAGRVDERVVREIADAMAANGMKQAGYLYINIDDTWEGERDSHGRIRTNHKFPDMKGLADYVHSKGLKIGIYSSPGPNTCAGYEGSYGHELQDAQTYAGWGIDYLKYDWCGARNIYADREMQAVYQKMGDALLAAGRPILYSLCQYGRADVWKWGAAAGGNLWRTTYDIEDTWESMVKIGFSQSDLAQWSGPGHWNDPDMLEIGNGGMSDTEYRMHMALWSMLAAPLLAGNDLRSMTPATLEILTNREVIAIDQDPAGKQARRIWQAGQQEIWARELTSGEQAIAIFNRSVQSAEITVSWADLRMKTPASVRDLWAHREIRVQGPILTANVPGHGVILWRIQ